MESEGRRKERVGRKEKLTEKAGRPGGVWRKEKGKDRKERKGNVEGR